MPGFLRSQRRRPRTLHPHSSGVGSSSHASTLVAFLPLRCWKGACGRHDNHSESPYPCQARSSCDLQPQPMKHAAVLGPIKIKPWRGKAPHTTSDRPDVLLGSRSQQIAASAPDAPVRLFHARNTGPAAFLKQTAALIVGRKLEQLSRLRRISRLEELFDAERSEGSDNFLLGLLVRHPIRRARRLPSAPVEPEDQSGDCATDCASDGRFCVSLTPA